jgi:aspartate racemase
MRVAYAAGGCKVGVLGGIGPQASSEFYSKLVGKLQTSGLMRSNLDFPQVVINSIAAPELISEEVREGDLDKYLEGIRELDLLGVDFIVMVCNTIHLFRDRLQREVNAPILDLRSEVEDVIVKKGHRSVLVIGTNLTVRCGLYRSEKFECVEPDEKEMRLLTSAIANFTIGRNVGAQTKAVRQVCVSHLSTGEVEAVLLGCTEFAVMLRGESFTRINTLDILVDATLRRILTCSTA